MSGKIPIRLNEFGCIAGLAVKHARDAFTSQAVLAAEWRELNFTAEPNFAKAIDEYDAFTALLQSTGAELLWMPAGSGVGPDSIYVRDAAVVSSRGVILCSMGKPAREGEPNAQAEAYRRWGIPIAGVIKPPGRLEGGDVVWLDDRTVAVGRGYRTNDEGIRQFRTLLGNDVDTLISVPLPHWRGPGDVFHLMSLLSPVDQDLAVVYVPLMPVPLRELLLERGMTLVEVPDAEFDSMGANVLAVAPRWCLMVEGNPLTRRRLESAGAEVLVYSGEQISLKGGGGPTCLTRPITQAHRASAGSWAQKS